MRMETSSSHMVKTMRNSTRLWAELCVGVVLLVGLGAGVCSGESLTKSGSGTGLAHGKGWGPAWYGYYPTCWRIWPVPGGRMATVCDSNCPPAGESTAVGAIGMERLPAPAAVSEIHSTPMPPTSRADTLPGTGGVRDLQSVPAPPAAPKPPTTRDD